MCGVCALLMCECMLKKNVLLVPADMIKLNSVCGEGVTCDGERERSVSANYDARRKGYQQPNALCKCCVYISTTPEALNAV